LYASTQYSLANEPLRQPLALGLRAHYGFVIPHSQAVRQAFGSSPFGIEAELSRQLLRQQYWQYCFCFPKVGVSMAYFNFDNPRVLGSALSAIAFVEPFLSPQSLANVSFRLGAGFSYLNRPYHPVNNSGNQFYSTHIAFNLLMNTSLNIRLASHRMLRFHGNFNHISNGGLREPNSGINYPTLGIAGEYAFAPALYPRFQAVDWRLAEQQCRQYAAFFYGTAKTAERNDNTRFGI
jgi:hypothetical protein